MKLMTKTNLLNAAFALMFFFIFSCSNEDLEKPTPVTISQQLQNDLKLEQFANKNLVVN
jgi:hypothetical protein